MRQAIVLASSLALLGSGPLVGCSGDGGGGVFGNVLGGSTQDAMALLPASVKQSAENYLSGLGSLTDLLAGVEQYSDLLNMVPQLEPFVAQVQQASQSLASLNPETKDQVTKAFGPKLADANGMFTSQVDRVKSQFGIPAGVEGLLGNLNLFG